MTRKEIDIFIEEMEAINDKWTPEQVEDVYGNRTLDEALAERKSALNLFFGIVGNVLNGD